MVSVRDGQCVVDKHSGAKRLGGIMNNQSTYGDCRDMAGDLATWQIPFPYSARRNSTFASLSHTGICRCDYPRTYAISLTGLFA
jgi:hypothetical protein